MAYPPVAVTVDVVVFRVVNALLEVLLVKRARAPYAGCWALPGGFKQADETLEAAARRELAEETHIRALEVLVQLKAYGDPGRDPRMDVVTIAHLGVVSPRALPRGGDDAADSAFHPLGAILSGRLEVAFDHRGIITDAVAELHRLIEIGDLAPRFIEAPFTLRDLRAVYEAIWGVRLDAAAFRRRLLGAPGWLIATGDSRPQKRDSGRAMALYSPGPRWRDGGPIHRSTAKSRG